MKIRFTWDGVISRQTRDFEISELNHADLVNLIGLLGRMAGFTEITFNLGRFPSESIPKDLSQVSLLLSDMTKSLDRSTVILPTSPVPVASLLQ